MHRIDQSVRLGSSRTPADDNLQFARQGNSYPTSSFVGAMVLLIALVLEACASIPRNELTAYRATFDEARAAGEVLIMDFDAARAEANRREAALNPGTAPAAPPAAIPSSYVPPQVGVSTMSDTKVRLLLWQAINEYNMTLAALAAGERVEEVQASAGRLVDVVGKLAEAGGRILPGAEALTALARAIAGHMENARTAAEFRSAVLDGVPIIRMMLDNCLKDASTHYELRARLANVDYRRVIVTDDLSAEQRALQQARIKSTMDEFRLSIDNYFRLIDQLNRALTTLQNAVDRPVDLSAEASRIMDVVLDLKLHWTAYQDARSEASNS